MLREETWKSESSGVSLMENGSLGLAYEKKFTGHLFKGIHPSEMKHS